MKTAGNAINRPDQFAEVNALLTRYYDGLYYCDVEKLKSVFHDCASYATVTAGALVHFDMAAYMSVIAKRTSPADRGDKYDFTVDAIRFAGDVTASAQVTCAMLGKRYTDFLSLLFIDGEWRIVAKIFHAEET